MESEGWYLYNAESQWCSHSHPSPRYSTYCRRWN
ncbi:hypothetical protein TELCIR_04774 [Teladorsagia circumcincta]|uniref:Uncharacterized protein n=1 Tax=Teladorsagia circumcincta TaxID=45464 RepID=A0A2G9UUS4_TELCI|nr:hypothetical protein TELCIR_04774 [Teladorsagia circumcincta]